MMGEGKSQKRDETEQKFYIQLKAIKRVEIYFALEQKYTRSSYILNKNKYIISPNKNIPLSILQHG